MGSLPVSGDPADDDGGERVEGEFLVRLLGVVRVGVRFLAAGSGATHQATAALGTANWVMSGYWPAV